MVSGIIVYFLGAAFLLLDPIIYANVLTEKMEENNSSAWLVNTGWVGGPYGKGGYRISIADTRKIINAILDRQLEEVEYETLPVFRLDIPKSVPGLDSSILNPRNIWKDPSEWDSKACELDQKFITNFENFADTDKTRALIDTGGPEICKP